MRDIAQFTELLFADQTLDDVLAAVDRASLHDGVWGRLSSASAHIQQGEIESAKHVLLELSGNSNVETRVLLWTWVSLKGLGVRPEPAEANEIKGVVVQVPMETGVDVLAAYADGTARYVNHSGKVIVWDIADAAIASIIYQLLKSAAELRGVATTGSTRRLAADMIRITLLRLDGNRVVEASTQAVVSDPINQVLALSIELIRNLIKRSESMSRIMSKS